MKKFYLVSIMAVLMSMSLKAQTKDGAAGDYPAAPGMEFVMTLKVTLDAPYTVGKLPKVAVRSSPLQVVHSRDRC